MPEVFNTTAAINPDEFIWLNAGEVRSYYATNLTGTETVDFHIPNATSSEIMTDNDEDVQLRAGHKGVRVVGPCEYKLVKAITASAVRVYEYRANEFV